MKTIFLLVLTCIAFSCSKKEDNKPYVPIQLCTDISRDIDTINKYIPGTWKWAEDKLFASQTGEYVYMTPETEGYSVTLKISGDTARFYKNSLADSTYRFQILKESDITGFPEDDKSVIAYYSFATGLRRNYLRIRICQGCFVTEQSYRSDAGSDRIWERF
jgi:hypothetical protein